MAYCKNCGSYLDDQATFCASCGTAQNSTLTTNTTTNDKGGFWWGALGCCIPIVGLILFLVWKDNKPKTSKAAGIGALVSVICGVVFYIIYFIAIGILAASGAF